MKLQEREKDKDKKLTENLEIKDKRCILNLDLEPFRSWVQQNYYPSTNFQYLAVREEKMLTKILIASTLIRN